MTRVCTANNIHIALSSDHFTFCTNLFYCCFNPHNFYYIRRIIRPLPPYGSNWTMTVSPTSTRIRFNRILPARYARVSSSWPSSCTRKSVFGNASTTVPVVSAGAVFCSCVSIRGSAIDTNRETASSSISILLL